MIRLVDSDWEREMGDALASAGGGVLRMVCPFIKLGALERILARKPGEMHVITRFKSVDFVTGASDIEALRKLLEIGAQVRNIPHLHAKMYLFGASRAIVTSANLTESGLGKNLECGVVVEEESLLAECRKYFDSLWRQGEILTREKLVDEEKEIASHRELRDRFVELKRLLDHRAKAGGVAVPSVQAAVASVEVSRAFVQLLGSSDPANGGSVSLSSLVIDEIKRAGCHQELCSPIRPRQVPEGAVMFIARRVVALNGSADYHIFGRAVAEAHDEARDEATEEDIRIRWWRERHRYYVRIHDAEFVEGTMAGGVSLYAMMGALEADAFASTQRNAAEGSGNINPRQAYMRRSRVQLSPEGFAWIKERLQRAFERYGKIPAEQLNFP